MGQILKTWQSVSESEKLMSFLTYSGVLQIFNSKFEFLGNIRQQSQFQRHLSFSISYEINTENGIIMKFYYSMDGVSRKIYAYPIFNQEHFRRTAISLVSQNLWLAIGAWHSSRNSKKLILKSYTLSLLLQVLRIWMPTGNLANRKYRRINCSMSGT